MPKLKTHKGAAKRFKKTGTGKVLRGQTKMRHILTSKEKKTKRHLGGTVLVSDADHVREYTERTLLDTLATSGWEVESIRKRGGVIAAVAVSPSP